MPPVPAPGVARSVPLWPRWSTEGGVTTDGAARTGHRIVDPLLAQWLRDGRPQSWPEI